MPSPSLDEFIAASKPLNPSASDEQLSSYWRDTYGGASSPAPASAAPSLDEFIAKAKPLNPDASDDSLKSYWDQNYKSVYDAQPGDTVKGFKRAFAQVPELVYGTGALAAMTAENMFGEGGLSTSAKNYFANKYAAKTAENQKFAPSIEFTDAWDNLKSGNIGSMVDWLQDSAGYVVGQGLQTVATGGVGALVGKVGLSTATQKMLGGVVAKQAAKIAEESAVKQGLVGAEREAAIAALMPEATKLAAERTASVIGAGTVLNTQNLGMEAGDIYGGLTEESKKTGKPITGDDLLRAWGAAAAAAGTETATDMLGLGALTGRIKIGGKGIQEMGGIGGRVARGATAAAIGMPLEGAQEFVQTGLEQYGAGKPLDTPEAAKERINAAAVGALGGGAMGGGIGLIHGATPAVSTPTEILQTAAPVFAAGSVDEAIASAESITSGLIGSSVPSEAAMAIADGYNADIRLPELATGARTQEQQLWMINQSANTAQAQKDAELDAIQRESKLPAALYDAEQANRLAEASGALDVAEAPTAMQLAMQAARARSSGSSGTVDNKPTEVVNPAPVVDKASKPEWQAFGPDSGTLGIPRADMPQVKAEHRGALVNFLNARGVTHQQEEVPASGLKATQAEFSPAKVEKAQTFEGGDRSILVSSDNHIVDGHHQALAKAANGEPIQIIRLNAPIRELLPLVHEFPSSQTAEGATKAADAPAADPSPQTQQNIPENIPASQDQALAPAQPSKVDKILGRPVGDIPLNQLRAFAERGGPRARPLARAEIARREQVAVEGETAPAKAVSEAKPAEVAPLALESQTEADLAAKTAREADEKTAERERVKRESEAAAGAFNLTGDTKPASIANAEGAAKTADMFARPANELSPADLLRAAAAKMDEAAAPKTESATPAPIRSAAPSQEDAGAPAAADAQAPLFARSFQRYETPSGESVFSNDELSLGFPRRHGASRVDYQVFDRQAVDSAQRERKKVLKTDSIGNVQLSVDGDGNITALHSIYFPKELRGKRWGEKVLRGILATIPQNRDLFIENVLPEARDFWSKMGARFEPGRFNEDAYLSRSAYERARTRIQDEEGKSGLVFRRESGDADTNDAGARAAGVGRPHGGDRGVQQKSAEEVTSGQSNEAPPSAGLSISEFKAGLADEFGAKVANKLIESGVITALEDQSKLPEYVVPFVREGDTIFGFYDPKSDRTYAVLSNLNREMLRGLVLHEVGTHYGFERMLGADKYAKVMKRLDMMHTAGNVDVREARAIASKESANKGQIAEETLAYLVQKHPKLGIVREIIAAIKAFLFKEFGIGANSLTATDLTALAEAAVRHVSDAPVFHGSEPAFERSGPETRTVEADGVRRPITNSNGQLVAPTTQAQIALWKWAGDTKVVDEQGRLVTVYHGTDADIQEFRTDAAGSNTPNNGMYGRGAVYATQSVVEANGYANGNPGRTVYAEGQRIPDFVTSAGGTAKAGANVMPLYVRIENPFVVEVDSAADAHVRAMSYRNADATTVRLKDEGHDGVIVMHNGKMAEVVPFDPEQIKSAIGNRGTFDANDPNILFSRAGGNPISWDAPAPTKLDNVIYTMADKQIDTRRVLEQIRKTSAVDDATDVRLQEELYHGRTSKQVEDFLSSELKPLVTELAARKVTIKDFDEYLQARHAEERNEQIAKINPDMPDGGSGMDTQAARDYLSNLTPETKRAYESLAKRVDAINAVTRQMLVDYGLESQDTIDTWAAAYKNYVPLYREDMEGGQGTGQGFSVKGPATKRAMGSKRTVVDILANIAAQREKAIVRGEKNRVANALVGLASANPNPDFWKVDEPPTIKYVDDRTGLVTEAIDPMYKSRDNVVMARMPNSDGKILERSVIFNEHDERAARMAQALKNLDMDDLGVVLGMSAKVTRYFSSINTQYNPVFGVVNVVRDVQGAMLNLTSTELAGKQADVLKHTLSALRGIYIDTRDTRQGKPATSAWAQEYEEFQNVGGKTGYRDMFRTSKDRAESIEREIARVTEGKAKQLGRAVFDWLSDYNTAMENAVRLAAYKVGKESGMTNERAASLAKNLTVNFNRKGQIATQAGALYAFFNASVQGTARLAETLAGPAGRKIIAGGLTLGAVQALMLAAAGFGDDEPPEYVRERNIIIPMGGKSYITIPMPLGLHVIPNLSRVAVEFSLSGFRDPGKRITGLLGVFADAMNPIGNAGLSLQSIAPTAIDPIAALAENKDFTGKPISHEQNAMNPKPGHQRAKDTATAFSKAVSKSLNWMSGGTNYKPGMFSPTPDQIDYLIGQVTGGVGREISKTEQYAMSKFTGEELPTFKTPLLGRFYGTADDGSSQANAFYSNLKMLAEHEAEIKGRMKAHEPVTDYLKENPEARLYKLADAEARVVGKLRKHKSDMLEHDASRESIRIVETQIATRMKRLNDVVKQARGG